MSFLLCPPVSRCKVLSPLFLLSGFFLFSPENGAIAEITIYQAAKEAKGKQYHHQQIAVKVIDDRGNEWLVVKDFKEDQ